MTHYSITASALVSIEANGNAPADWLSRVTTEDFPYWRSNGDRLTEQDGLEMLVYNAVANGVDDASRLDGWADLSPGMVTMAVLDVEIEAPR